ncbi:Rha family transcriptional regulator [Paenibacillus tundrae]
MNQLNIVNNQGKLLADSRDIATMTGKQHAHLLRDIEGYKEVLDQNPNLDSDQFITAANAQ